MRWDAFCGPSYTGQSVLPDCERLVNWYLETVDAPGAKAQTVYYPTPGTRDYVTVPEVGTRALYALDDTTLAVVGPTLYRLNPDTTKTALGSVATDNNLAYIVVATNITKQALIGSGGNGYNLDLPSNTLTAITNLAGHVFQVGMLDDFAIAFDATTGTMRLSNHADNMTWDPTQFALRSAAPDRWRAMIVVPPDIWLIGQQSGDVWYDAGAFPFPFAPRDIHFKFGIAAPMSLAAVGSTVLWLTRTAEGQGQVVRTAGYQPQRISTFAVETAIAQYAELGPLDNVEGLVYQDQGHAFYCLRFPTAGTTWVYDLTLNSWHERGYWNAAQNTYEAWRPRVHCFAYNKHLVGDAQTGVIQELTIDVGLERDGTVIRRLRRAPGPFNELQRVPIRVIEVYLETGTPSIAIASSTRRTAMVLWRDSDDGGRTWGTERRASAGSQGEFRRRVQFWRCGVPRDRVSELTCTDAVPWRIVACYVNNDTSQ